MKGKLGIALMFTGCSALIAAIVLVTININTDIQGKKKSEAALKALESKISVSYSETKYNDEKLQIFNEDQSFSQLSVGEGVYSGIIDIPEINIKLPVMSSWSYKKMKTAPCIYSVNENKNQFIIAAHNYSSHFGNIKQLESGDYVTFTDIYNNFKVYSVVQTEILNGYDIQKMIDGDDWNLTLFTCTLSGTQRVTVRCKEVKPDQ